ncbi:MAG: PRC-barrel domain-containing protein [Gammaproteobacteria bacterium]|jgi:sporulation protein YlmC with PRC-barrel domain|nr:PRC-barrel domain-containing protein [Gammaproteobacteria bacterium]
MHKATFLTLISAILPALAMNISPAVAAEQEQDCTNMQNNANAMATGAVASNAVLRIRYLSSMPVQGYYTDNLIGQDVINRHDNKVVGAVHELVFNRNGQIVAAIINTGSVLDQGEREMAISWNQIERQFNGDVISLSVDMTDEILETAPKYARR